MTREEAVKATRNAAIAALISAGFTVVVVLIAIINNSDGQLAYWNDPTVIVDVVLVVALAMAILRKSRVAAVTILLYFVAAKLLMFADTGKVPGLFISFVFVYLYVKGIQGAFVFHRLERADNPERRATSVAGALALGVMSAVTVVMLSFAIISALGISQSTRVQAGHEISDSNLRTLRQGGIVGDDEKVLFFYAHGLFSPLESGHVLTEDRVILYHAREEDGLDVYSIDLDDVTQVAVEDPGGAFANSVHVVYTADPEVWLKLFLSTERKGDQQFVGAIRKMIGHDDAYQERR